MGVCGGLAPSLAEINGRAMRIPWKKRYWQGRPPSSMAVLRGKTARSFGGLDPRSFLRIWSFAIQRLIVGIHD
jgi:hypothetical protein